MEIAEATRRIRDGRAGAVAIEDRCQDAAIHDAQPCLMIRLRLPGTDALFALPIALGLQALLILAPAAPTLMKAHLGKLILKRSWLQQ